MLILSKNFPIRSQICTINPQHPCPYPNSDFYIFLYFAYCFSMTKEKRILEIYNANIWGRRRQ
jgi:hypothetical protein